MASRAEPEAIPDAVVRALERLVAGAVGLTSAALAGASAEDLTLPQWRALVVIGRGSGIRVSELAARLAMSLPSASRIAGRLQRRGLVDAAPDPRDRRATVVRLTPAGTATRDAVIARREVLLREALATSPGGLPADIDRGLAALAAALDRYA
jgi:DNA-binding MarR family transcriptional regulator